jgi:uncharacterized membrane protein
MSPISLFVPCALIAIASIPLMLDLVPPNRFYGVRTRRTLADRALWFQANRFAGWALFIACAFTAAVFWLKPEYASGRSLVGLAVFFVPLAIATVASLLYVRSRP